MGTVHDRCAISMLIQALPAAVHSLAPAVFPAGLRGIGNSAGQPHRLNRRNSCRTSLPTSSREAGSLTSATWCAGLSRWRWPAPSGPDAGGCGWAPDSTTSHRSDRPTLRRAGLRLGHRLSGVVRSGPRPEGCCPVDRPVLRTYTIRSVHPRPRVLAVGCGCGAAPNRAETAGISGISLCDLITRINGCCGPVRCA